MKKSRGFTLMELLGTITIITIIMLIVFPNILNLVRKTEVKLTESQKQIIYSASNLYIANNSSEYEMKSGDVYNIKLNKLVLNDYLDSAFVDSIEDIMDDTCVNVEVIDDNKNVNQKIIECKMKLELTEQRKGSNYILTNLLILNDDDSTYRIEYSKDDGKTWMDGGKDTAYIYNGLKKNTTYTLKARVIENGDEITESNSITVTTSDITTPVYEIDKTGWTTSKVVTITYPTVENQDLTYQYSLDKGASWKSATQSQKVTFNANGTIIARVKDGTNTVTASTFTVNQIDTTIPTMSVAGNTTEWTINKTLTVTASDSESGLHATAYSFDNGSSWQTGNSKTITANGTYYIKVRDNAGNIASQTVTVNKIAQIVTVNKSGTITRATGDVGLTEGWKFNSVYTHSKPFYQATMTVGWSMQINNPSVSFNQLVIGIHFLEYGGSGDSLVRALYKAADDWNNPTSITDTYLGNSTSKTYTLNCPFSNGCSTIKLENFIRHNSAYGAYVYFNWKVSTVMQQ